MNIKNIFVINGRLRAGWRICIFLLACIPIVFLSALPKILSIPSSLSRLLNYLIYFFGALAISYLLARYLDKRFTATIGFMFHSRWLKEYLLGVLIGFVLVSIIFFFELGMDYIEVEFNRITLSLLANIFILWLIFFIFQSAFEELMFRGYIFQNLIEGTNVYIATAGLSILFGVGHLMNPNSSWVAALNITGAGVLFALGYIYTKSLWLPSGLHFGWNFFMGTIYSLPVSGIEFSDTLLVIVRKGPTWLTGGDFGPEAGVPLLILVIAACLILYFWKRIKVAPEMAKLWDNYNQKYKST